MVAGGGAGGNGAMYRARSEADAKSHAQEIAQRPSRPQRSRRQTATVAALFVLVLLVWGLVELLA